MIVVFFSQIVYPPENAILVECETVHQCDMNVPNNFGPSLFVYFSGLDTYTIHKMARGGDASFKRLIPVVNILPSA